MTFGSGERRVLEPEPHEFGFSYSSGITFPGLAGQPALAGGEQVEVREDDDAPLGGAADGVAQLRDHGADEAHGHRALLRVALPAVEVDALELGCRSRSRTFMNRYGASSLSHSMRVGSPRTSLLATSASSWLYAASTACGGVRSAGRSFSVIVMLIAGKLSAVSYQLSARQRRAFAAAIRVRVGVRVKADS
jgi:hypothetical protein